MHWTATSSIPLSTSTDLFFGIEVLKVQEVLRYLEMTSVPLAPDVIEGSINLRGQIVTAVDMRRRLSLSKRNGRRDSHEHGGALGGRRREPVSGRDRRRARSRRPESYEPPPDNMPREQRELIEGVYKLEGRLLLVLNAERVLQTQVCS